jgi:hypothetical protein
MDWKKRVDKFEAEGNEIGQADAVGNRAPTYSPCNLRAKRVIAREDIVDSADQDSRP